MIEIVNAKEDDALIIHNLAHEIWRKAYKNILSDKQIEFMLEDMYTPESILSQIENGEKFLLLRNNKHNCGFASFSKLQEPGVFKIHKLYIHPDLHGKGAGRQMIFHIIAIITQQGAHILELNVNRENPAKDFYLWLGFRIYKSVDTPYHHFILNDYIMRLDLSVNY